MDFRVVGGLEAFLGKEGGANSCQVQEHQTEAKGLGSGFCKQERSHSHVSGEDDHRSSKMARTDEFLAPKTMPLHQGTPLLRSNSLLSDEAEGRSKQHMLSFSSVKSEPSLPSKDGGLLGRTTQGKVSVSSPYYHYTPALYSRNAGLGSGSLNTNMHGAFPGVRGPFTPSQWIELEHQALIYKYLNANVPVPSNLLIPIKKAFNPFGLSGSSGLSIPPNSLAWNSFHLGFAGNNTDPEPGRCRRTDGKKWRCSRDAVADQKYCERHINRGRHRSRKPVEGQNGHAVSGTTSSKVTPMASSLPTASVITNSGGSNNLAIAAQQLKSLHTSVASTDPHLNRRQDTRALSISSPTINMKSRDGPFSILKQQNPFEDSSQSEFGFVSSDSLLNPSQKNSYTNGKSYGSSFLNFSGQESQDQHTLRQFMEDWPKQDQSNRSGISWPEELKSDWTQLSMSIPMTASDFSSSSSSPAHEKLGLSPLRLSREFDPVQMGLGVSSDFNEPSQKHTNWIPISWGTEMGGPLGEVLHSSKSTFGACKNSSSALNLMSEGWDGSPHFESSPTGVLQKANFGSLSNSSTSGSSPRAENKRIYEGASICEDVLASTMANNCLSIPSL